MCITKLDPNGFCLHLLIDQIGNSPVAPTANNNGLAPIIGTWMVKRQFYTSVTFLYQPNYFQMKQHDCSAQVPRSKWCNVIFFLEVESNTYQFLCNYIVQTIHVQLTT